MYILLIEKIQEQRDCIPDYSGPCYDNGECCSQTCSHSFICVPNECLPDYSGPCFENQDCCSDNCSHSFICVP